MISSKKGQIAATLNWSVAFVVIFFIMIVYLAAVFMFAADKKVSPYVGRGGFNEVVVDTSANEINGLEMQNKLEYLLSYPVSIKGNETDIRGFIALWLSDRDKYDDLFEEEVKKALAKLDYEEYDTTFENVAQLGFQFRVYETRHISGTLPEQIKYIPSGYFESGYCYPRNEYFCLDSEGIYVPILNTNAVYVTLMTSRRAKK